MASVRHIPTPLRNGVRPVPPLRHGDRMDVPEFLRRWEAMPEPRPRAELLEGTVWLSMSPIGYQRHDRPQVIMATLMGTYEAATPGVQAGGSASLRLNLRSMPEPDAFLRLLAELGGRSEEGPDDYLEGAPELVVEIAATTVRKDTGLKFDIYRRAGVCEYVVWKTERGDIDWFIRRGDRFDPLPADDDGAFRSETFPGLWLDVSALLRHDVAAALATLHRGLASRGHAAFVRKLQKAGAGKAGGKRKP
jgi:Uma2 family endonuclease